MATKILLQSTIPYAEDDWHIGRFTRLREHIAGLRNADGAAVAEVVARDRAPGPDGDDPVLAAIDESDFDQLWLFAVDTGGDTGITKTECAAIGRFRARGGAVFATRDHMDLGASICNLGGIGAAHFFHTENQEPDAERRVRDDEDDPEIDFPNYHSGANGDVQRIATPEPVHPVLGGGGTPVRTLPSHPHEGAVGKPAGDDSARVVATGVSAVSGRTFNIAVAFEPAGTDGPGWAESTFHHFCDYNWDMAAGCPSFVTDPPSDAIAKNPALLDDTKRYVANLVRWLGGEALPTVR